MKVYYAHCMSLYDTVQETRDLNTLRLLGFEVVNPNDPTIEERCTAVRAHFKEAHAHPYRSYDPSQAVMDAVFVPLVQSCHILAFRALPDGTVSSGVWKEIEVATEAGLPVIELPALAMRRVLPVAQTRAYLREVGAR